MLVAAPWAAGLAWAAWVVLTGEADREFTVAAPATVAAIVGGSMATALAAAVVVGLRYGWPGDDGARSPAAPEPSARPLGLLHRLDREVAARVVSVGDLVDSVRAAAERGVLAPADVAALQSAAAEIDELGTLVADLNRLSDLASRGSTAVPVDIGQVLGDVVTRIEASPGLGGRQLSGPRIATTVAALGDPDLLLMALQKVVLNAITYSRPGDTIAIRASDDGPSAMVVEVSDTGRGIPAEEISLVGDAGTGQRGVEPSHRAGLGLALARAAVERHGGAVRVRSREGLGTVVTVVLPAARRGR